VLVKLWLEPWRRQRHPKRNAPVRSRGRGNNIGFHTKVAFTVQSAVIGRWYRSLLPAFRCSPRPIRSDTRLPDDHEGEHTPPVALRGVEGQYFHALLQPGHGEAPERPRQKPACRRTVSQLANVLSPMSRQRRPRRALSNGSHPHPLPPMICRRDRYRQIAVDVRSIPSCPNWLPPHARRELSDPTAIVWYCSLKWMSRGTSAHRGRVNA